MTVAHTRLPGSNPALVLGFALTLVLILAGAFTARANAEETAHSSVTFSCASETFKFEGFPNAPNNRVREVVSIDHEIAYHGTFTFNGPTGENTVVVPVPPGHHSLDALTTWRTNGVRGHKDQPDKSGASCEVNPDFTIRKYQELAGTGSGFTTHTLALGHVGETVDYKIVVTNTGNVPLTFTAFSDPRCDEGTITGGPGASPVPSGGSTTYLCEHVLREADREAGTYVNAASVTGTPPEGDGPPITEHSNPVVVELPTPEDEPGFSCDAVTFTFAGFPNVTGNKVSETITVDGHYIYKGTFEFDGSSATNSVAIELTPGHHAIDARASWKTHGFIGGDDTLDKGGIVCEPQ